MQISSNNENQETRSERISQKIIKLLKFNQNIKSFALFTKVTIFFAFFIKFTKSFVFFIKITRSSLISIKNIIFFVIFDKIIKFFIRRKSYNNVYNNVILKERKLSRSRATFTSILLLNNYNIS